VLVELRRQAALAMGLSRPEDPVVHAVPKVGIVGAPTEYRTSTGTCVGAEDYDVSVRMVSMLAPHPAIGLTSAVAVAAAAAVPHSIVAERARVGLPGELRIGTAAGVIGTTMTTSADGIPKTVTLHRAARRIATAELFIAEPIPSFAGSR
jgi:2-methylaconitate cis-trans-isomerase PrpF